MVSSLPRLRTQTAWLLALAAPLLNCGGESGVPSSPSASSAPRYSVTATVFYDQNGDGNLDPSEAVRVPGVEITIGAGRGTSVPGSGQAVVTGIQEGALSASVRAESLPVYFQPPAPIAIQVPGKSDIQVPLTLPIGRNNANLYLGLGDSITQGDGSSDGRGYTLKLQNLLGPHLGRAEVIEWGRSGDTSQESAEVTRKTLGWFNPAYTLVLFGTNDWHDQACQTKDPAACFTIDSLRSMIEDIKDWGSLPVIGTIIPVNPAKAPAGRNAWNDQMNVHIKALTQQQNVALADLNAEFKAAESLAALYADEVHPNDAGYRLMAQAWFKAITRPRPSGTANSSYFGFAVH